MKETTFHLREHLLFALLTVLTLILCIGVGSVSVPFRDTAEIIFRAIAGWEQPSGSAVAIILYTRLPRVLCVALVGAMLALGGCAMQGLLRNPLADGSTLGVSSGASLGAALAILSGVSIPFLPFGGTAGAAMLSAFLSLVVLLALAFALDHSLATNTLILLGVVFSMFVSALLSLLITFSGDKLRAITFWTMGNLSSASYQNALTLLATLLLCGGIILTKLDGTAKGGIAVAIQSELKVPVKYIGVGETIEDLQKFDPDEFVNALFDVKLDKDETDADKDVNAAGEETE